MLIHARDAEGLAEEISQEQFLHLYGELVRQQVRLSLSLSLSLLCVCVCVCMRACVRVYQYA